MLTTIRRPAYGSRLQDAESHDKFRVILRFSANLDTRTDLSRRSAESRAVTGNPDVTGADGLAAMAGKRLSMPGFFEVGAVRTHPEARGQGFARVLTSRVMEDFLAAGRTLFLHTLAENETAIRVYADLGFTRRPSFQFAAV
jgi:predicted GNAT family acetyltransferase